MKFVNYIIGICVITLSCKKDQLKDEKAVFIGKWEWVHTTYFTNACEGSAIYQEFTPASEGVSFELEFHKEGIFELRKNEIIIASFKTKFKEFKLTSDPYYPGSYYFIINFNNDEDLRFFGGLVNKDSIVTSGFEGFEYSYDGTYGCGGSSSHFIKKP